MRLTRKQHQSALGFNMTSMIDIVFLLIIFFMAVSQISKNYQRQVELPSVAIGWEKLSSEFTVNVASDQTMRIGARQVDMPQLIEKIREEIVSRNIQPSQMLVRIRFDKNQDSSRLNQLELQLGQLGVTDLQYSVIQRKN